MTLTFAVVNDTDVGPTETLILSINGGAGYTVGSRSSASASIADSDVPVGAALWINSTSVTESDNGRPAVTATFTVTHTGNLSGTSTVNWATSPGTALAGSDHSAASGVPTFAPNETSKTITISIAADKKSEPTEQFTVVLSVPSGGTTIGTGIGTVTIQDNDGALLATAAGASASATPLAEADAVNLLAVVVLQWLDAGATADRLAGLTIRVADLPGTKLADTLGRTITLDIDAAGWGWALSPTADRIDLAHEVGHMLGLEHGAGLMGELLAPGESLPVPESWMLRIADRPVHATTTLVAPHDPVRTLEMVVPAQLAPTVTAATAVVHAHVSAPAARELLAGPGRSATEFATQALSRVSPSQQHEPLTVVLLGLALAALIGRRRTILVRSR